MYPASPQHPCGQKNTLLKGSSYSIYVSLGRPIDLSRFPPRSNQPPGISFGLFVLLITIKPFLMKCLKRTLIFSACFFAIVIALATRPKLDCTGLQNYYFNGQVYIPAGVFGQDYFCAFSTNICTYYLNGGVYQPCRQDGDYTPILCDK
jgi:hypothetical protein